MSTSTAPSAETQMPEIATSMKGTAKPRGRRRAFTILFAVLLVIAAVAFLYWLHARQFESTDDAQIDAHLNPISARIDGTISRVYVDDNQSVKAGDPLVDLDRRDFQAALDQVLAQLSQARSMVIAQEPNVPITQVENRTNISSGEADVANARAALGASQRDQESAQARVAESQANNARAQADLARYALLVAKEEVSQQEYDQILATAKAEAAALTANQAALASSGEIVKQRRAQLAQAESKLAQYRRNAPEQIAIRRATVQSEQASVQTAQAQVEQARLKLSYCTISAPVPGIVMKRSAEMGAHISAGQQLLQIAQINDVWVTANFNETQLRNIKPGQSASVHVDALNRGFDGYVENISGSTGAVASVLPPENATGNFVKIVQRIPVRIRFRPNQAGMNELRPGMSVEPKVRVGD
jgi:membrane fusion protein (multidrug efflux system)